MGELLFGLFGIVVGAVGVLIWNEVAPDKVARFTAKHLDEIEREVKRLKERKG